MKKRLILLFAAVLLALPLGANVAMADGGGNRSDVPGDTGNACPPNSPQPDGDPSCGTEGNGKDKADRGNSGNGNGTNPGEGNGNHPGGGNGNGPGGGNGNGPGGGNGNVPGGDNGNACPPNSPNVGGEPPCGDGEDDGEVPDTETDCEDGVDNDQDGDVDGDDSDCEETPATETDCEDGVDNDGDGDIDGDDSDCGEGPTAEECAALVEGPPPIVIEIPASPLLYACIILFPGDGDAANCPDGAVPVALPAHPLVDLCIVVGPEAPAA